MAHGPEVYSLEVSLPLAPAASTPGVSVLKLHLLLEKQSSLIVQQLRLRFKFSA